MLAPTVPLTDGKGMRWVLSFFLLVGSVVGATYVYLWNHHLAVPLAMGAVGLVFSCMALAIPGETKSTTPARRFNQPESEWPESDTPAGPDSRLYRRRLPGRWGN
jgi:hypothetical protein